MHEESGLPMDMLTGEELVSKVLKAFGHWCLIVSSLQTEEQAFLAFSMSRARPLPCLKKAMQAVENHSPQ
jgi:hypothetical protein